MIILGLSERHPGVILGLLGAILGASCRHLGVMFGSSWVFSWGHFGVILGVLLGSFWGHVRVILGPSWSHPAVLRDVKNATTQYVWLQKASVIAYSWYSCVGVVCAARVSNLVIRAALTGEDATGAAATRAAGEVFGTRYGTHYLELESPALYVRDLS